MKALGLILAMALFSTLTAQAADPIPGDVNARGAVEDYAIWLNNANFEFLYSRVYLTYSPGSEYLPEDREVICYKLGSFSHSAIYHYIGAWVFSNSRAPIREFDKDLPENRELIGIVYDKAKHLQDGLEDLAGFCGSEGFFANNPVKYKDPVEFFNRFEAWATEFAEFQRWAWCDVAINEFNNMGTKKCDYTAEDLKRNWRRWNQE